jgi:hypothetical protein
MSAHLLRCDVCGESRRVLIARTDVKLKLCTDCFERLDQLDRDHLDPAFMFAQEIVRNRDAAGMEGVR